MIDQNTAVRVAQFLASALSITNLREVNEEHLTEALMLALDHPNVPAWVREALGFQETALGVVCPNLPAVIAAGVQCDLWGHRQ